VCTHEGHGAHSSRAPHARIVRTSLSPRFRRAGLGEYHSPGRREGILVNACDLSLSSRDQTSRPTPILSASRLDIECGKEAVRDAQMTVENFDVGVPPGSLTGFVLQRVVPRLKETKSVRCRTCKVRMRSTAALSKLWIQLQPQLQAQSMSLVSLSAANVGSMGCSWHHQRPGPRAPNAASRSPLCDVLLNWAKAHKKEGAVSQAADHLLIPHCHADVRDSERRKHDFNQREHAAGLPARLVLSL
jgi:hypothetical protein